MPENNEDSRDTHRNRNSLGYGMWPRILSAPMLNMQELSKMSNFILPDNAGFDIHGILIQEAPEFKVAPEYVRLSKEDYKLPYVLVGAFAEYVIRIFKESNKQGQDAAAQNTIDRCFNVVELLVQLKDQEVLNIVHTEIFEAFYADETLRETIISGYKEDTRREYEKWYGDNGSKMFP